MSDGEDEKIDLCYRDYNVNLILKTNKKAVYIKINKRRSKICETLSPGLLAI